MLTNQQIADVFANIADMLEILGENKFKFLSYRRASDTLRELPRDLGAYEQDGTLEDINGVGKAIGDKIREMLATGKLDYYERLKAQVPETLVYLMRINGVGAKKAKLFWESLGITTIEALEEQAKAGKLRDLDGMGEKSEQKILAGIQALSRQTGRLPIGKAKPIVEAIFSRLMQIEGVEDGAIAGSIRRGKTTIGDGDILIASDAPTPIMQAFLQTAGIVRVLANGETKSSIELQNGLQVDVRVLPKKHFGTALQYFTGSKEHNVKIRQIALDKGYSLNESAFSPVDSHGVILPDSPKITFEHEQDVYNFLGLQYIPPELREDSGEIERAQSHTLPRLITREDIHADLHMHTTWSDGTLSIKQMAEEALQRGCQWVVITDHSRSLGVANGLSIERLLEQQAEVRRVDAEMNGRIRVLHGTEMDIKADGTLDFPDEVLAQLDFVIASLHVSLTQPREQITQRLLTALRNPHVDLIGHPSARYIPDRDPVDADWDVVFQEALKQGIALEINSNPRRLDLDSVYARRAIEMGILLAINTDSHNIAMMDDLPYGVLTARRGWVEAHHVINTWTFEAFDAWVKARH